MYVLECGAYDDIVQWRANGRAFVVLNPKDFEKKILPELFREAKYTSFEKKVSVFHIYPGYFKLPTTASILHFVIILSSHCWLIIICLHIRSNGGASSKQG